MFLRAYPWFNSLIVVWVCAIWAADTTGADLHGLFVEHVVCAEHGVMEHVTATAVSSSNELSIYSAAAEEHGEACFVEALPSTPLMVVLALPQLPLAPKRAVMVVPSLPAPQGQLSALILAPKTSPPPAHQA